jgi:hypothetical protein
MSVLKKILKISLAAARGFATFTGVLGGGRQEKQTLDTDRLSSKLTGTTKQSQPPLFSPKSAVGFLSPRGQSEFGGNATSSLKTE